MIIGIPSYRRAGGVCTLDMIDGALPKENIIISTQTEDDFKDYKRLYSDRATIIYRKGGSVGENRNNVLEHCFRNNIDCVVMLDDDILDFVTYTGRKLKGEEAVKLLEDCIKAARKMRATLFGTYPVCNSFFMKRTVTKNILTGTCFGVLDTSLRFDTKFRIKEDYELCLRVMQKGGNVIRFNTFAPNAKHKTAGGCSDDWKAENYSQYAEMLACAYSEYVKINPCKKGEIKFIKK